MQIKANVRQKRWSRLYSPILLLMVLIILLRAPYTIIKLPTLSKNGSTSLAYRESLGFFDDILDTAWIREREKAHSFKQYKFTENPSKGTQDPIMWHLNNIQPNFSCPHMVRVGGHGDGPKWMCNPQQLKYRSPCLVYSIGSEGVFLFEDSLAEITHKHCEIHVFDPANYGRSKDERNNIYYHAWGMKSSYDDSYRAEISLNALDGKEPTLKTFQETTKELGHSGKTIDVLKIDCEKCEWATFKDFLSLDIRQILIEVHGTPNEKSPNEWYRGERGLPVAEFFDSFFVNDYALFSKEVNVHGGGNCIEYSFIKLHQDFWKDEKGNRKGLWPTSTVAKTTLSRRSPKAK